MRCTHRCRFSHRRPSDGPSPGVRNTLLQTKRVPVPARVARKVASSAGCPDRAVPGRGTVASTDSAATRARRPHSGDTDASVMARLWRVRVRPWSFAGVRRVADLPFLFAVVRQFALGGIPKLRTRVRFSSPAPRGPHRKWASNSPKVVTGVALVGHIDANRCDVHLLVQVRSVAGTWSDIAGHSGRVEPTS